MPTFGQTNRILNFTSPLGADVLLPEHLTGVEGISELFDFQLDLLAETATTIDPKKIVGQKVCIGIQTDDSGTERYINGIVASFSMTGGDDEFNTYRARIVPNLWTLTLNVNTRVFQEKTVLDVIQAVLSPYNISPSLQTSGTYTPMEYCTQYRETDFDFISRLMEQHGIFYYFSHTKDDHSFTLQDVSSKLSDCAIQASFDYQPQPNYTGGFYDFIIRRFISQSTLVTGEHTAWDYSFIRDKAVLASTVDTKGPLGTNSNEQYDYANSAAAYLKKDGSDSTINDLTEFFATIRRDSADAETLVAQGVSNAIPMQTGYTFTLTSYPNNDMNVKYLLTHIEHEVQQLPTYRSGKKDVNEPYSNRFRAVPASITYRAPIKTRKPTVSGMHTGLVVAQSGEESYMDKYGRVNVQFWWDRLRKANTPDNTVLRVAQSWAGKGWGTYFWPRLGDEVLIDFIEGDPDQPIVVGSVYNGVNMPKYDPAGQYTLSGILTRSSKGGAAANANELRFEDLAGKEQIFMNAEKDYDLHVEHDWHTMIGNQQHETITDDHYMQTGGDTHYHIKKKLYEQVDDEVHQTYGSKQVIKIGADRQESIGANAVQKISANSDIDVGANLTEAVGANMSLKVGVNEDHKIGMNYNIDAGMIVNLKAGMQINIDAPMGINITCGGNFVNLTPAGVMIQGILVNINSGGAAMSAQSANAQSPKSPDSPTAPKDPTFPGDTPPSQAASGQTSAATTTPQAGSGSSSSSSPASSAASSSPAAAAAGAASNVASQGQQATQQAMQAAQQATQEASQAAQQAAQQAQQAANQAQQAAKAAEQQAQAGVDQTVAQARQSYQQANQAVQQAQQAVSQASAQGQAAAQQALNQAQQEAQQTAQQAAQAVQQAQQQAQQVQQQAQQAANQAQQAANQAQQQAQQAAQQAQQQAQQAAQQGQQAGQQAAQQAQQAAQQAQQQAQQSAQQAQQAAQQAQQQAQQAQQQVTQAASQAQQQAQQASQAAQQSAQQAMNSLPRGF